MIHFPFGYQSITQDVANKSNGVYARTLFDENGGADVLFVSDDIPLNTVTAVTNRGSASGANGAYTNGDSLSMSAVDTQAGRTFRINNSDTQSIQVTGYTPSSAGITTPLSCGLWVKNDDLGEENWYIRQLLEVILRKRTDNRFEYILNSFTGATDRVATTNTFLAGVWYFVVGRYAGGSNPLEIYVDGALEGSQVPTGTYGGSGTLEIGRTTASTNLDGFADMIFMRKSDITPTQISNIFNATKARYGK